MGSGPIGPIDSIDPMGSQPHDAGPRTRALRYWRPIPQRLHHVTLPSGRRKDGRMDAQPAGQPGLGDSRGTSTVDVDVENMTMPNRALRTLKLRFSVDVES
jgi:hypothetical protein